MICVLPLGVINDDDSLIGRHVISSSPAATGLTVLCGLKFFSLRIMLVQATNLKKII